MADAIEFPSNVQVGKRYLVPHVRNLKGEYMPINSHLHEDKKVINFPEKHWHIDWRFLACRIYSKEIWEDMFHSNPSKEQVKNVIVLLKDPLVVSGDFYNRRYYTDNPTIYYKRVVCKRDYAAGSFHLDNPHLISQWPKKLSEQFCKSKLKQIGEQLICPHKGIVIDKNCKDENGNYVCPGHLLRFNPETLNCVQ